VLWNIWHLFWLTMANAVVVESLQLLQAHVDCVGQSSIMWRFLTFWTHDIKLTGRKIKPQAGADSWIRCRIFLHSKSAGKVWISKSYTQNQHWNETLFCIIIITREWRCRLQFFYLFNPLLILFSLIAFRLWFLTCFCLRRRVNCIFNATLFMQSS